MNLKPSHQPTGTRILSPRALHILALLVAAAGAGAPFLPDGSPWQKGCLFIVSLGASLGIVSRGVGR